MMTIRKHYHIKSRLLGCLAWALLLFVSSAPASAQDGTSAYSFLDVTQSSKIYGLGGVNISLVDDDMMTTDQNPALLGQEMSNQLGLSYMRYVGGSNFAGLRYALGVGSHGTLGLRLQYFGYGSITESDETGAVLGSFSPKDVAFGAAYSYDISSRLRGGAEVKFLYSGYHDYTAFAIATDLGINYYDEERDLSLSAVVANLGGQIKRFNESYDHLPIDVRLGWSQSFGSFPVRFSVTAWNLTKWDLPYYETGDGSESGAGFVRKSSFGSNLFRHLVFGADLIASRNWYLGIGYNYKTRTDMATYSRSFLSGFSLTGGLRLKAFGFSLAFAQPHTGATTFMFNVSCDISDLIN